MSDRRHHLALRAVLTAAALWSGSAWAAEQAPAPAATPTEEGALKPAGPGGAPPGVVGTPPSTRSSTSAEAERKPGPPVPATASATAATTPTAEVVWGRPTPTPPDLSPHWVPVEPSDHSRSSADAGVLKGVRVLSLASGVARLQLAGEPLPRALRVGDQVGSDTVVRIEATRIVLTRPAGPGDRGDAIVLVKAGRDGLGWVRVYSLRDPGPPPTLQATEAR